MKSRWTERGPLIPLCLSLFVVSLSGTARAQADADKADDAPRAPAESAPPESPAPSKAEGPEPPKPEPEKAPAPEPPPHESPKTAEAPVAPLSVEILPGAAYPEPRVRGLKGGSLWLTMHGLQWPYMPQLPGQSPVRLGISGSLWDDTAYARIISGTPDTDKSQKRWTNQSRAVLRVTPTYSTNAGWFAQSQIELVANGDQLVPSSNNLGAVDDLYFRVGKWNVFDVTVGRFQGWEVYHYGMGLDLNTLERHGAEGRNNPTKPPQVYGLDFFWDRPNGGAGDFAAHVYFTDYLRLEMLGQIGTQNGSNATAFRPVGILDLGYVKLKLGFEYGSVKPQQDDALDSSSRNGIGGAVQFVLNPYLEGGVNGAIGYVDSVNFQGLRDSVGSTTTKSVGGFLNGRLIDNLLVGFGAHLTRLDNLETNGTQGSPNFGKSDVYTHFLAFAAVQYALWDKVFIKFVGSRASFTFDDYLQDPPHSFTNGLWGGRLRLMYLF